MCHTCPMNILEFEPLCKEDTICSSILERICAKRNRATTFIGHQGRNLKVIKLRLRSPFCDYRIDLGISRSFFLPRPLVYNPGTS